LVVNCVTVIKVLGQTAPVAGSQETKRSKSMDIARFFFDRAKAV